ncbi:hypothetical protein AV540_00495 [Brevibacillus parabrevis]|uniref:GNAT family N-acetyltransferase n=1 Tax=Brevibacillus parabrevis TaxID=54914 RepID=UPI0007AB687B|nr:GNAT family N-acetyltransferase [Brevibacillus parabrevis]KZE51487.1 hypothetical protein AV540_00495 [Brevibacillus parabrevis]
MNIRMAKAEDAAILTALMHAAFKTTVPPSSALLETAEAVAKRLTDEKEQAGICWEGECPVGMVRFQWTEDSLYFYRLSVDPDHHGKGIGRSIIRWLHELADANGKAALTCRVRMEMEGNMRLYQSEGFILTQKEIVQREGTPGIPTAHMRKQVGK